MSTPTFQGRAAVVTIDLHRGHLDPSSATMPLDPVAAERVVHHNRVLLDAARRAALPVFHVVTRYRSVDEVVANPYWAALAGTGTTRSNASTHQIEPTIGTELMPGLYDPEYDVLIDTKKRYDGFLGTDLGFALGVAGVDTLLLTGVNTNSCVLTTAIVASTRDYAAVVVSDCVDSMDGPDYHEAALRCIERAFGWVLTTEEALRSVGATTRIGDGQLVASPRSEAEAPSDGTYGRERSSPDRSVQRGSIR